MILYPLLMFYILRVLGLLSNNIFRYIKNIGLFCILPFPVITLLMRMLRSVSDTKFGFDYVIIQFIEIAILPVIIYWYMHFLFRLGLVRGLVQKKTKHNALLGKNIHNEEKNNTIVRSEYMVFIPLVNYFCITISNIIINNTYFNWVDILIYPLIRMTMTQVLIVSLLIITTAYKVHQKKHRSQSYTQYKLCYIFMGIYILFGLLCALIIMVSRNTGMFIGGILTFIIVLLGYISIIIYSVHNKTKVVQL